MSIRTLLLVAVIAVLPACRDHDAETVPAPRVIRPEMVAISGGAVGGSRRSNTREAIDASAQAGFPAIHVDLVWTADARPVLSRPWREAGDGWVDAPVNMPTHAVLKMLTRRDGLTAMTLSDLAAWLTDRPDPILIVLEVHQGESIAFERLAAWPDRLKTRVVPLIDHPREFALARDAGFTSIMFQFGDVPLLEREWRRLVERHPLLGAVVPTRDETLIDQLLEADVPVYVRPVGRLDSWSALRERGVAGVFTDRIDPATLRP